MNLSEATNVAKRLKNHYRAFEKLEEALGALAAAEGQEKARENHLEDLKKQIAAGQETINALEDRRRQKMQDLEHSTAQRKGVLEAQIQKLVGERQEKVGVLETQLQDLEQKVAEAEQNHRLRMDEYGNRETEAKRAMESAERSLSNLKKRVAELA